MLGSELIAAWFSVSQTTGIPIMLLFIGEGPELIYAPVYRLIRISVSGL